MIPSRLLLSVFVLMLAAIPLSNGLRGTGPKMCCFRFHENQVPRDRVVGYIRTSQRCSNPAVLLKTVTGRQICVNPSANWVKDLISLLDNKPMPGEVSNM